MRCSPEQLPYVVRGPGHVVCGPGLSGRTWNALVVQFLCNRLVRPSCIATPTSCSARPGNTLRFAGGPLVLPLAPVGEMAMRIERSTADLDLVGIDRLDLDPCVPRPIRQRSVATPLLNLGKVDKEQHRFPCAADRLERTQCIQNISVATVRCDFENLTDQQKVFLQLMLCAFIDAAVMAARAQNIGLSEALSLATTALLREFSAHGVPRERPIEAWKKAMEPIYPAPEAKALRPVN